AVYSLGVHSFPTRRSSDLKGIWALKDVSFEVTEGEALGFIGNNGAGKSTLLRIISRITAPTTGIIRGRGRVVSLLEIGAGFHGRSEEHTSELQSRENLVCR